MIYDISQLASWKSIARKVELGLILEGKDAEEFLENESSTKFTSSQIDLFREAKRIYRSHRTQFKF
jgi:hypothetical protein